MKHLKERITYLIAFIVLFVIEVIIALYVHDRVIRPYVGDVLVVMLIYCFVRVIIPTRLPHLPLLVFGFASCVEVLQYFDFVTLIGLGNNAFAKIIIGTSFSFVDILCYLLGCVIIGAVEYFRK